MRLLVSVADAAEARAALRGGADIIDAKEPRQGALGAVAPDMLRAIRDAVGVRRPVSAALGDCATERAVETAARLAADVGAAFVKVGFLGVASPPSARRLAAAARRGAGAGTAVVVVAYADWQRAGALPPGALLAVAREAGAAGALLDTAFKDLALFDLLPPATVGQWVARAHAAGVFAALAGSLQGTDFATARELGADFVGVRGAACTGGRTGRIRRTRVARLRAQADPATATRSTALV